MSKADITHSVESIGGRAVALFYGLLERNMRVTKKRLLRGNTDQAANFVSDLRDLSEKANIAFATYSDEDVWACWSELREKEEVFLFLLNTLAEFRLVFEFHYDDEDIVYGYDALVEQLARASSDFASSPKLAKLDADITEKLPVFNKQHQLLKENNWLVALQLTYLCMRAMDAMNIKIVFVEEEDAAGE